MAMAGNARIKQIEEQLAYLSWRKLQNERSVRTSLEISRAMKQKDNMIGVAKNRRSKRNDIAHRLLNSTHTITLSHVDL